MGIVFERLFALDKGLVIFIWVWCCPSTVYIILVSYIIICSILANILSSSSKLFLWKDKEEWRLLVLGMIALISIFFISNIFLSFFNSNCKSKFFFYTFKTLNVFYRHFGQWLSLRKVRFFPLIGNRLFCNDNYILFAELLFFPLGCREFLLLSSSDL